MFGKRLFGLLLVFVLLVTGFSGDVSAKSGGGCGCLPVVDHGVFLNNTTDENTLLIWVDGGDVFFTSSYNDCYNTTLRGVLSQVDVLRYDTDDWGEYGFYTGVYVELNRSLKTMDTKPYRSFRHLSNAVVLLWSHGDKELYETLVDIARTEVFSNILYSENITSPDEVKKSLFLYDKANDLLDEDKVPAAVALYNAALHNLPTSPVLNWDKITRLSYNGNNTSPVVFSSGGVLHAGWIHREDGGVNYTFYARSTNFGRTWWTLDATTYGSPYLVAMGLDPYGGDPFVAMAATQLLESIYLIDGSHYFYVPINTPPVLPPTNPPIPPGGVGDTVYVSINDPNLDLYPEYEFIRIGDMAFIKPICKPGGGVPVPPPRAPDLVVEDIMFSPSFPYSGAEMEIYVKNIGDANIIGDIEVDVYQDGIFLKRFTFSNLNASEIKRITSLWQPTGGGHEIKVVIDPVDSVKEGDENNNELQTRTDVTYEYYSIFQMVWERKSDGEIYYMVNSLSQDIIMNPWCISHTSSNSVDPQIVVTPKGVTAVCWIEEKSTGNRLYFANSYRVGQRWYSKDVSREESISQLIPGNLDLVVSPDGTIEAIIGDTIELIIDLIQDFGGIDRGHIPKGPGDRGVDVIIEEPKNGDTVSGLVKIKGTTEKPVVNGKTVDIAEVRYAIVLPTENPSAGDWHTCTDTSANGDWSTWEVIWDTTQYTDTTWKIVVEAYTRAGQDYAALSDRDSIEVTVDNTAGEPPEDTVYDLYLGEIGYEIKDNEASKNLKHCYPQPGSGYEYHTLYGYPYPDAKAVVNANFKVTDWRDKLPDGVYNIIWTAYLAVEDTSGSLVNSREDAFSYSNGTLVTAHNSPKGYYEYTWNSRLIFDSGSSTWGYFDATWASYFYNHKGGANKEFWDKLGLTTYDVTGHTGSIKVYNGPTPP